MRALLGDAFWAMLAFVIVLLCAAAAGCGDAVVATSADRGVSVLGWCLLAFFALAVSYNLATFVRDRFRVRRRRLNWMRQARAVEEAQRG